MCERFIENFVEKVIEKTKNPLKLYHVSIPDGIEPDDGDFIEFLVAAYSEEEARNSHPGEIYDIYTDWMEESDLHRLIVTEIGISLENVKKGVIFSSVACL